MWFDEFSVSFTDELQGLLVGGLRWGHCRPQQQYPHLQVNGQRWAQLQAGHGRRLGGGQILLIGEIFRLVFKQCVYQYHWSGCAKSCPQTWRTFNQTASESTIIRQINNIKPVWFDENSIFANFVNYIKNILFGKLKWVTFYVKIRILSTYFHFDNFFRS